MTTLLVHLHVFYHEQVDYFIYKLGSISDCDWDLLVTYSEYNQQTEDKIRAFKPESRFIEVENVGYDVWPFIKVLQQTDFSQYKYVMKLHTKNVSSVSNRINGLKLKSTRWRNLLVNSLLGSKNRFRKNLRLMESNPKFGFICAYELSKSLSKGLPEDLAMLQKEAKRIGMSHTDGNFVAGTMFLARLDALQIIKRVKITPAMFRVYASRSHSVGSLAHVYERLLCFAMYDEGYVSRRVLTSRLESILVFFHRGISPLLKMIFSLEREGENQAKVMTVLGLRFRLDDGKK